MQRRALNYAIRARGRRYYWKSEFISSDAQLFSRPFVPRKIRGLEQTASSPRGFVIRRYSSAIVDDEIFFFPVLVNFYGMDCR